MRFLSLTALLLAASPARAELGLTFHGGTAYSHAANMTVARKGQAHLTLHDMEWKIEPFRQPFYWGLRAVYWKDWMPGSGFGIDFVHSKLIASGEQAVYVSGDRGGASVQRWERVDASAEGFAFTHGLNFVMVNLYERWGAGTGFRPHVGAGAGFLLPHAEGRVLGETSDRYRYGGLALQLLGGAEATLAGPVSLFAEYKLHHSWVNVPYGHDTTVSMRLWTHQLAVGLSTAIATSWEQP